MASLMMGSWFGALAASTTAGSAAIANSCLPSSPLGHHSAEADLGITACLPGRLCSAVAETDVADIDPHAVENDGNRPGHLAECLGFGGRLMHHHLAGPAPHRSAKSKLWMSTEMVSLTAAPNSGR
jgi:hypothetical protein